MSRRMNNTDRQREIMHLVLQAADEGRFISLKELHARLIPESAETAMQCSIRFLAKHGMVERVYGPDYGEYRIGEILYVKPTILAYAKYRPAPMKISSLS